MKRIIAFLLTAVLFCSSMILSAYADEDDVLLFEHLSLGTLEKVDRDGYNYHCIYSDLYYIEYPGSFSFGTRGTSQAFWHPDNQIQTSDNEFKTFNDERLIGSVDEIDAYVRNGGIQNYLTEVLPITENDQYQFVEVTKDSQNGILIFRLMKGDELTGSIFIWTNYGHLSLRSEIRTYYMDPLTDHGEILLYPVWDKDADFSSIDAINAYLADNTDFNNNPLYRNAAVYNAEHHQYVSFEMISTDRKIYCYIPVTPDTCQKWILAFAVSKDSQVETNAYNIREDIVKTFQILK